MDKTIVVIGAFDTKGVEYKYILDIIKSKGYNTITVNVGVMNSTNLFQVDVSSEVVAEAGGTDIETLRRKNDRGNAIKLMCEGAGVIIKQLFSKQKFDGIVGMGGTAGTAIVTTAMRALPVGLPKVCVSTVASGDTSPYLQTSDIVMMPALTDISGINRLSSIIFTRAVGALIGMLETTLQITNFTKPVVSASMFGNTTPCINQCRKLLEEKDYEVLVFHATGIGGRTMEGLIYDGFIQGVIDITTTEWADTVCGGVFDAGNERLDAPGKIGIPHLIAPGCIDMCNFGHPGTVPVKYKDRLFYKWNPNVTLMRTTSAENKIMGEIFAEKANIAKGKVAFIVPQKGFSMLDSLNEKNEPQLFWDPAADKAFTESLKSKLKPGIEIIEVDANINDSVFAEKAVDTFLNMM